MEKSVFEISKYVCGVVVGDGDLPITGLAGLKDAKSGDLSFLANMKYAPLLENTKASAVFVSNKEKHHSDATLIKVDNPSKAFSQILSMLVEEPLRGVCGIHPSAVIAESATIGNEVNIGPCAVIEDDVVVSDRTTVGAGVFIGRQSIVGKECFIYPNVSILHQTKIGDRVIIHSGTVIGSDGFGYLSEDGQNEKIPQIGIVEIDDDVEIGANVTIDRARFDRTFIGAGTKIDNLVQIAHNVKLGKGCLIVSQVGISGSTVIQDYVVIGGQVGVAGHITIGEGSMVAAQSGIVSSVPPKSIMFGSPALPHMKTKRMNVAAQKLPDYLKITRNLQERVDHLEKQIADKL